MAQPLAGVRVLECGCDVAGAYTAKLLADYGASVITLEPPAGVALRRQGPFPVGREDVSPAPQGCYPCAGTPAWTIQLGRDDVLQRCQAAGVPAGPVLDVADCLADPHLAARSFFRLNGSEDRGMHRFPGHLWRWDGPDMRWGPLCQLGVDNDRVFRGLLGLSDQEFAALEADGHISRDYLNPDGSSM